MCISSLAARAASARATGSAIMKTTRVRDGILPLLILVALLPARAQKQGFRSAPASAAETRNPYARKQRAIAAGARLYTSNCGACHGRGGKGSGNVPALTQSEVQSATDGEIFWFITRGDVPNGMPAWNKLPAQQRWQLVAYVKSLRLGRGREEPASAGSAAAPAANAAALKALPPPASFADYRFEAPGRSRKITLQDLPPPYATESASNGPDVVTRPRDAWPKVPPGFKVDLYAAGLDSPRTLRTAPNGDVFLAESDGGDIRVFRGMTANGKPEQNQVFASGLRQPYGIAFYPPGPNPQWVYIGNANVVVRFPYKSGEMKAGGAPQHIADLPDGSGHWTRDLQFSADGKKMFVGVGSRSNVDDPDRNPGETNRADILVFAPDGSGMRVYASGIRNPGGGLGIHPRTGELWCSVNERDGLGDNLVPDYITHVQENGFYGWPWWYMGGHQDPRHQGKHPELKQKVITPDVLLQAHNASLNFSFYTGKQFPAEYQDDIFAAEHGSWNRAMRAGYEVVRVPLHQTGHASGEYEDFMTGFVLDNGDVWGRPVGVTVAPDGSLLVSDDGSGSLWRVSYTGK
jgi:glucose/arabinose dehydrogenase